MRMAKVVLLHMYPVSKANFAVIRLSYLKYVNYLHGNPATELRKLEIAISGVQVHIGMSVFFLSRSILIEPNQF